MLPILQPSVGLALCLAGMISFNGMFFSVEKGKQIVSQIETSINKTDLKITNIKKEKFGGTNHHYIEFNQPVSEEEALNHLYKINYTNPQWFTAEGGLISKVNDHTVDYSFWPIGD